MLGQVTVRGKDSRQTYSDDVEKLALFIGYKRANDNPDYVNKLVTAEHLEDGGEVEAALGRNSMLLKELRAASLNAGAGWRALITTYSTRTPGESEAFKALIKCFDDVYPEFVVFVDGFTDNFMSNTPSLPTEIEPMSALFQISSFLGSESRHSGKTTFAIATVHYPDAAISDDNRWKYAKKIKELKGAAPNIALVAPYIQPGLGALAGRLASENASIADSPMRVQTGSVLGLKPEISSFLKGAVPSVEAELYFFNSHRISVPQKYADFDGIYWSDLELLTPEDSDFRFVENRRVRDKAIRAVRRAAIKRIGDRLMNDTPNSIAVNKSYFIKSLRDMARKKVIQGVTYPGEIEQPTDDAVDIIWLSKHKVEIHLSIKPYGSPKHIDVLVSLDLTTAPAGV